MESDAPESCGWADWPKIRVPIVLVVTGVLSLPLAHYFGDRFRPGSPARLGLMLAPMLLYSGAAVAFAFAIRRLDELLRQVHLQAATVGFVAAVITGFLFDGLNQAGVLRAAPGDAASLGIVAWAIALIHFSRHYHIWRWQR